MIDVKTDTVTLDVLKITISKDNLMETIDWMLANLPIWSVGINSINRCATSITFKHYVHGGIETFSICEFGDQLIMYKDGDVFVKIFSIKVPA